MGVFLLWVMIATLATGISMLLVKMTWIGMLLYWLLILYAQIVATVVYGVLTTRRAK